MSRNPFKPNREMVEHARRLRREQTPAERVLWEALRGRRFRGLKFRRQHPIGCFVVDFYCPAEKLVVEVDGAVHEDLSHRAGDAEREQWLAELGLTIVRVSNDLVLNDMHLALDLIAAAAESRPLDPPPSEIAGGGNS
jgi:very-short-patch-repair endonuclease